MRELSPEIPGRDCLHPAVITEFCCFSRHSKACEHSIRLVIQNLENLIFEVYSVPQSFFFLLSTIASGRNLELIICEASIFVEHSVLKDMLDIK